jgi:hypothetical protein
VDENETWRVHSLVDGEDNWVTKDAEIGFSPPEEDTARHVRASVAWREGSQELQKRFVRGRQAPG